jgi:hypothetical protein
MRDLDDITRPETAEKLGRIIGHFTKPLVFAGAYALIGGLAGEICDQLPYLHHAIPEGISYFTNAFTANDASTSAGLLDGNIDKLGAVAGFFRGFYPTHRQVRLDERD